MSHHSRYVVFGYPQHIIARGNHRQAIFGCNANQITLKSIDFRQDMEQREANRDVLKREVDDE